MKLAVQEHTQAVLDIMPRIRRNSWWSSNRNLHVLLVKFANSQSFLARDKIYALLGMSEDACDPEIFYPCYLKSEGEVIRGTASFLLFGEFRRFPMPDLQLAHLSIPIAQLAAKVLIWAVDQQSSWALGQRSGSSGEDTAALMARQLNKGRYGAPDVLMVLAKTYGGSKTVAGILSGGDIELFWHVELGVPWHLHITVVDPQVGPRHLTSLGQFVVIRSSPRCPPSGCLERGDDSFTSSWDSHKRVASWDALGYWPREWVFRAKEQVGSQKLN
jgi:hypothetical protein